MAQEGTHCPAAVAGLGVTSRGWEGHSETGRGGWPQAAWHWGVGTVSLLSPGAPRAQALVPWDVGSLRVPWAVGPSPHPWQSRFCREPSFPQVCFKPHIPPLLQELSIVSTHSCSAFSWCHLSTLLLP